MTTSIQERKILRPRTVPYSDSGIKVKISSRAYAKMFSYIDASPIEVSGFGSVRREGNIFIIEDLWLTDQVNTGVSTVMIGESLARDMRRTHQKGKTTESHRNWWHSHVDMASEFSWTDFSNIERLCPPPTTDRDYTISIVANKRREYRCRVDFYKKDRYAVDYIPLIVEPYISSRLRDRAVSDIERCEKESLGE